jgi:hypothetical protein
MRFEFEFLPAARPVLLAWGVTPGTAHVDVEGGALRVRFGFFNTTTPLTNVTGAKVTGPYKAIRAIGPRLSLSDRGATFATTTAGGVCITFAKPIKALFPKAMHPGLTVTVADRAGLVAALTGPTR